MKKTNWSKVGSVFSVVSLAVLVLVMFIRSSAQTVQVSNPVVDPAKPQALTLQFTKDGAIDTAIVGRVVKVTVGGADVAFTPEAQQGKVTITPPPNLTGSQPLILLDKDGFKVGEVPLEYRSAAQASPTATPDLAWVRQYNEEMRRNGIVTNRWYYPLCILVFLIVLVPFIATIVRGIMLSRATYRSPLGLPVGSFRSILAYSLVAFLGLYILTSLLTVTYFAPPDFLLGIVATVIGFYFGSRGEEPGGADSKAGTVRGTVRKDKEPAPGAQVKFKTEDGAEPYSRIADVDGRFELRGAKPGKYKVSATLTGAPASEEKDITITEGSDQEILIVLKSASTSAQTGTVKGTVKKPDGTTPAADAKVELLQGDASKRDTKTGANGTYEITGVTVGPYHVRASLAPHQPSDKVDVTVTAGGQHSVDLKLKTGTQV